VADKKDRFPHLTALDKRLFPDRLRAQDDRMKITQELNIPVHVIQGEDGSRQIVRDIEDQVCDPAKGENCKCCVLWRVALQAMRDDVVAHDRGGHTRANRDMACNVCQMAGGAFDNPKRP